MLAHQRRDGSYEYRGWIIRKVSRDPRDGPVWEVRNGAAGFRVRGSLTFAKRVIDRRSDEWTAEDALRRES